MTNTKYTPGPLTVFQPEKFPFPIQIVNAKGEVVFEERRFSYCTGHKSVADVMCAKGIFDNDDPGLQDECIEANERQLADAYIRAAAPELLEALVKLLGQFESEIHDGYDGTSILDERLAEADHARAAIAKATGGAA